MGYSTGDTEVGQEKAILWARISQLELDRKLNMITSPSWINLNLFSVDKTRPTFPVGTENHWPVSLYEAKLSITSENSAHCAMVGTTGVTGLPRASRRYLRPCKRKHPYLIEFKTCFLSRAFTNLLWLHTRSSISSRQFIEATRRQSQAFFQKLVHTPCATSNFVHQHKHLPGQDFPL